MGLGERAHPPTNMAEDHSKTATREAYLSDVATLLKTPVTLVPTAVIAVMITMAIKEARNAYSIAVAPSVLHRKR